MEELNSVLSDDETLLDKRTQATPRPKVLDVSGLADDIASIGQVSSIDISTLNSFDQASQTRDQLYQLLDQMGDDPTVAAVLETYAEDATEYNKYGDVIWSESDDANVNKYITFLLKSLNVNKNAYTWVYSMIKYGDIYWELYRESEYKKDEFFNKQDNTLNEAIEINLYAKSDHYVHYIQQVPNPATMFELTKFGKTAGFIRTDISTIAKNKNNLISSLYSYKFKKDDINIYNADKFVHACLEDTSSRIPEEVVLFKDSKTYLDNKDGSSYTVRRGQSLLYNVFKIWRELTMLENSMLLNRVTKSSITRVINVEIGDMPKEDVRGYLLGIKQLLEQKTALDAGNSISDYTNPGPIENNIYVPTHNGQGVLTTSQIGGDVNVGQLPDIDYFTNKYYGALRVPKQYFGFTDDGAGFNGGQSLAIISSRYAKMIKRIQNTLIQGLTDVINLMLIDKGLESYLGKFTLKMQAPTTQEEIERRDASISEIQVINDIMNLLSDIEDQSTKLKILKILLSSVVNDAEITNLIEKEITKLEHESEPVTTKDSEEEIDSDIDIDLDTELDLTKDSEEETDSDDELNLPTPEELDDIDFTDNNQF